MFLGGGGELVVWDLDGLLDDEPEAGVLQLPRQDHPGQSHKVLDHLIVKNLIIKKFHLSRWLLIL